MELTFCGFVDFFLLKSRISESPKWIDLLYSGMEKHCAGKGKPSITGVSSAWFRTAPGSSQPGLILNIERLGFLGHTAARDVSRQHTAGTKECHYDTHNVSGEQKREHESSGESSRVLSTKYTMNILSTMN